MKTYEVNNVMNSIMSSFSTWLLRIALDKPEVHHKDILFPNDYPVRIDYEDYYYRVHFYRHQGFPCVSYESTYNDGFWGSIDGNDAVLLWQKFTKAMVNGHCLMNVLYEVQDHIRLNGVNDNG